LNFCWHQYSYFKDSNWILLCKIIYGQVITLTDLLTTENFNYFCLCVGWTHKSARIFVWLRKQKWKQLTQTFMKLFWSRLHKYRFNFGLCLFSGLMTVTKKMLQSIIFHKQYLMMTTYKIKLLDLHIVFLWS